MHKEHLKAHHDGHKKLEEHKKKAQHDKSHNKSHDKMAIKAKVAK